MATDSHVRRPAYLALLPALAIGACADSPTAPQRSALDSLPPALEAISFTANGRPTSPYVLLELRGEEDYGAFAAVNADGEIVWFFETEGSPFGATRRANGNFVLLDSDRGLLEVSPDGGVVREIAQQQSPGRVIHHDVTATPSGTILFIAEDTRPWPDTLVTGEALWEWDPERGTVERRWSAFDHLDPDLDRGSRSRASDWLHANAVSVGLDGNVLLSLHFLDQVVSISPGYDGLEWRLGGVRATLPVDDPFSGQHTAAEVAADRVLLFDNGFDRDEERYSRAVEYDLSARPAGTAWQWRPDRDNWARVISSARRLPNGNTLVAFGTRRNADLGSTGPIEVYEVTRAGEVVWHLVVDGAVRSMYRATPLFEF